jgi:hypothetical protein
MISKLIIIAAFDDADQEGSGMRKAMHPLGLFACAVALVPVFCRPAYTNPVSVGTSSPADLLIIFSLSFVMEYWILKHMLKSQLTATPSQFTKSFFGANAISFPIAWAIYVGL